MKQARVLDEKELKRALAVAGTGRYGARNQLMLMLSHFAGLRVGVDRRRVGVDQQRDHLDGIRAGLTAEMDKARILSTSVPANLRQYWPGRLCRHLLCSFNILLRHRRYHR